MGTRVAMLVSMVAAAGALGAPGPVRLSRGVTQLADIGIYRISYRPGDGDPVEMPPSWSGHFETVSGISYSPGERVGDRNAILLHCPWRGPTGPVRVDYPLLLPDTAPIRLRFGIIMRPGSVGPERGDGATFACLVGAGGAERELLRTYYTGEEWQEHEFDLTAYRGREITLSLVTDPGPAGNSSFDFSCFGTPEIVAGADTGTGPVRSVPESVRRAAEATSGAGLAGVRNRSGEGITPGNILPARNRVYRDGDAWVLAYEADDCSLAYRYVPRTGTLDDIVTVFADAAPFAPAAGGGVVFAGADGRPATASGPIDATLSPAGDSISVRVPHTVDGKPITAEWSFGIRGKALTLRLRVTEPVVERVLLGGAGAVPLKRPVRVPYLQDTVTAMRDPGLFVFRSFDWTVSHASRSDGGEAVYEPKTDGARNAVDETAFVAVSPDFREVLPNIPHPPSPYRELLAPRIMLDVWGHHRGDYRGDAEILRDLKDSGVDHLAIIQHVWQRYGYDAKLPDHIPADPRFGGDEGMAEYGRAARECGYVWSVHENYIDIYPDAPSYDPAARVLRADGTPSPAWFNRGTGVQSYGLKCNRALEFAKANAPEIHRRYGTNAAYLDVHTCVPPWHQLDHEAGQPMAAMALGKVKADSELFAYMRETHGGPLFGEGYRHFYWAGLCDGVEAQVDGGENHRPLMDFDLLKIQPQMINHGMGYYERWYERGYDHRLGYDAGTPEQIDKYRAQEIAYGHAGFIGNTQTANIQWVAKEHHLMHPVQRLYGNSTVEAIEYEVDGAFLPIGAALFAGETGRQRIRYASGLTVWVNWLAEPWRVEGRDLPQWGFLALGPGTEVRTALADGKIADYAECPEYVFADARTAFTMPYLNSGKNIRPAVSNFEDLGDGRFRIAYRWEVDEALGDAYTCFVHFLNTGAEKDDAIVFQQDHGITPATDTWTAGSIVEDGPHESRVPAEAGFTSYDVVVGLYNTLRRLPLEGRQYDSGRTLLGRIEVQRNDDGTLGSLRFVDVKDLPAKPTEGRADFSAHMNPPGTTIDFGKVVTDGSVKVERKPDALLVYPYPRERAFGVSLDLAALLPGAEPGRVAVHAVEARTGKQIRNVPSELNGGFLSFRTGTTGAVKYEVRVP